jgi:hypothetical protein
MDQDKMVHESGASLLPRRHADQVTRPMMPSMSLLEKARSV